MRKAIPPAELVLLESKLARLGDSVATELLRHDIRLVLAESCTGGLVAATLARTPGISGVLTGSFVTYQNASKQLWLGVPARSFGEPPDPMRAEVARAMAEGSLRQTPHAELAVAITGRLGPSGDREGRLLDGFAWLAGASRKGREGRTVQTRHAALDTRAERLVIERENALVKRDSPKKSRATRDVKNASNTARFLRRKRQLRASILVLEMVRSLLKET